MIFFWQRVAKMIFGADEVDKIRGQFRREGIVCVRLGADPKVQAMAKSLPLYRDLRVWSRRTLCLDDDEAFSRKVRKVVGKVYEGVTGYALSTGSFPVEYREYQPNSHGMAWHRDLQMYEPAQVEMVYTVFNDDAKTRFEWKDASGKTRSLRPVAGDLVLVRPNGPLHRVTGLGEGKRGIVKIVGVKKGARPLPSMRAEAFMCPRRRSTGFWVVVGLLGLALLLLIFAVLARRRG